MFLRTASQSKYVCCENFIKAFRLQGHDHDPTDTNPSATFHEAVILFGRHYLDIKLLFAGRNYDRTELKKLSGY